MIDSGSDIETLDKDVIEALNLPVIGRCEQEGAGGSIREVSLYSACLGIGEKKLNIKVRRLRKSNDRCTKIVTMPIIKSTFVMIAVMMIIVLIMKMMMKTMSYS